MFKRRSPLAPAHRCSMCSMLQQCTGCARQRCDTALGSPQRPCRLGTRSPCLPVSFGWPLRDPRGAVARPVVWVLGGGRGTQQRVRTLTLYGAFSSATSPRVYSGLMGFGRSLGVRRGEEGRGAGQRPNGRICTTLRETGRGGDLGGVRCRAVVVVMGVVKTQAVGVLMGIVVIVESYFSDGVSKALVHSCQRSRSVFTERRTRGEEGRRLKAGGRRTERW